MHDLIKSIAAALALVLSIGGAIINVKVDIATLQTEVGALHRDVERIAEVAEKITDRLWQR